TSFNLLLSSTARNSLSKGSAHGSCGGAVSLALPSPALDRRMSWKSFTVARLGTVGPVVMPLTPPRVSSSCRATSAWLQPDCPYNSINCFLRGWELIAREVILNYIFG